MFRKILIANRGEIAMRIIRACRELGIATVAVHSDVDAGALHVRFADEAVCIGPAAPEQSYLNVPAIISAAEITAADAIHPGYGFLSENAEFAEIVDRCELAFIGPGAAPMLAWGDKITARENAERMGIPLLPASGSLSNVANAQREAKRIGYPVILKARAGGGGRGMRIVRASSEMKKAFDSATKEAGAAFKNAELYVERFLERPRHIEFQALGDRNGQAWTLGERECSLQRRHQKLVEEAPSPAIDEDRRTEMGQLVRKAVRETGYDSLGTFEFLMDESGDLYFMEMNTRVQVEHPVTEMATGVDLVIAQIRVAAGQSPELPDTRPWSFRGHTLECRITAEDPITFAPCPGKITEYHPPGGAGIRVDAGVFGGWTVPSAYDSLLAKVIVQASTRDKALARMRAALDEFVIGGIRTNIPLQRRLMVDAEVAEGRMTTRTVDRVVEEMREEQ